MEEKQNREKTKAKKTRKEGEDARLCQTFQEKKKNVESLAEMKEKLAKIQTAKKVETKELAKFDDQVEGLEMKNEATENQKVNCLEVVAAEFQEEVPNISPLKPRLSPEASGLRAIKTKKTKKTKPGTSKPKDA